jgi:hypothetical protein
MDKTKTSVIIGIVAVVLLGAVLYALRGNFNTGSANPATTTES